MVLSDILFIVYTKFAPCEKVDTITSNLYPSFCIDHSLSVGIAPYIAYGTCGVVFPLKLTTLCDRIGAKKYLFSISASLSTSVQGCSQVIP